MPVRHDPAQFFDRRRRWRGAMTLGRPLSDLRRVSLKLSPPSRIRHYFSYRSYCIVSAVRPMNTRIIRVFRYLAFRRLRTENRSVDSSILSLATNLRLLALHTAQASDGKPRRESATPRCPEWSRVPSLPHCLRRPDIYTRRPTSLPVPVLVNTTSMQRTAPHSRLPTRTSTDIKTDVLTQLRYFVSKIRSAVHGRRSSCHFSVLARW